MRKILNVPFYSQRINVSDAHWQERACGILSLKMALDFLGAKTPTPDEFIKVGVSAGAYGEWGWTHEGLVTVAGSFGVTMKRKEFRSQDLKEAEKLLKEGINEFVLSIEKGKPVLISAIKKWVETKKFHMMVLVGFEMDPVRKQLLSATKRYAVFDAQNKKLSYGMDEGVPACRDEHLPERGCSQSGGAGRLKGFYYHDPDAYTEGEGKNQFVPIETFKTHWRRMAIFAPF